MDHIIYFKMDKHIHMEDTNIRVGDLGKVFCDRPGMTKKISALTVMELSKPVKSKPVISVLYVIQTINDALPSLNSGITSENYRIESVGEQDCVISYMGSTNHGTLREKVETALVSLVTFFGAAFAIMTYNEDVDVPGVFEKMYQIFSGTVPENGGILELTYSIGIGLGIIVFFNHFERKGQQRDPTPMEVQMGQYEEDVVTTIIKSSDRRGEETDVDD